MSEWKETTIGELLTLQRGHDLVQTEFIEGSYLVAGSNGPIGHHNSFTTKGPGLTIGRSGNSIGVAHYYALDFWAHNTVLYSKKFYNSDPKFVYYLLKSIDFKSFDGGSAVPTLNRNHVHPLQVRVPINITEQRDIAEILTSLEDKINLLHRQNKTLEQLAETLFRQWFVEEADESWETVTISDVAEINVKTISKYYPFPEIEYLDTGSVSKGIISDFQTCQLADAPSRAQRIASDDDIVYSLVRPIQRHYGLLYGLKPNTIVSTGFCVLSCPNFSPHFLYVLLTRDETVEYFDMIAEGSTSTYPSLKPSDIANFEFQKPPQEKLQRFSLITSRVWKKINTNHNQIRTLTQLRDTLLPKLMSGEVRVETGIKH